MTLLRRKKRNMQYVSCSRLFTFCAPKCATEASKYLHNHKFGGGRACSSASGIPPSPVLKMSSCKESQDGSSSLECWHFLKQLPDRIIRDIGFVVLSPSILLNSHELPMVCPDVFGGGIKTWSDSATWLATLDVDHVKQWFEAKSNNGRLGEHFAFCVEYVLLYSPFAHAENLMTYKQVTDRTVDSGSKAPQIGKENHVRIAVEVEKGDVLIKSKIGKGLEIVISETADQRVADQTEMIVAPCNDLQDLTIQPEGETHEPEKLEGDTLRDINEPKQITSEKVGKRKRKLLRKMRRLKDGIGVTVTIGEFDFLFEHGVDQDCELFSQTEVERIGPSQAHQEIRVNHWEVSVKFLLYAGPWEVFGFQSPNFAAWHSIRQESSEELVCQQDVGLQHKDTTCSGDVVELSCNGWHANAFLGCFLGPHVGETLYNRKTRLMNQLALSQNIHAAFLLFRIFGSRARRKITSSSSPDGSSCCLDGNSCTSSGKDIGEAIGRHTYETVESEHAEVLRVSPRAFLKGYLFYEYDLWCQLYPSKTLGQSVNCYLEGFNSKHENAVGGSSLGANVNPEHWMGWWTRAQNLANFAGLPIHKYSKWYIVPKLEWLSPVVINGADETRAQKVLSLDEFLIVAEKISEEAEETTMSRKRRFMVAELVWETLNAAQCASDQRSMRGQVCDESTKGLGRWSEVSRGFVVEDTWPDSRVYRPHGYRLSSLP